MADNQETADIKIQYYVSKDKNPKKKKKINQFKCNTYYNASHYTLQ